MQDVTVQLWVGEGAEEVEQYTVSVADGVVDTEAAIEKARQRAHADGYEDVDLKEVSPE